MTALVRPIAALKTAQLRAVLQASADEVTALRRAGQRGAVEHVFGCLRSGLIDMSEP